MDRLEKAFEMLKKGYTPKKIARKLGLSEEEIELLKISSEIKEIKPFNAGKEEKRVIYERISYALPARQSYVPQKKFILGLASFLIAASTIVGAAAYNSTPESPLYALKKTYSQIVTKFAKSPEYRKKILKREIKEYQKALRNATIQNDIRRAEKYRYEIKKRERLLKVLTKKPAKPEKNEAKQKEIYQMPPLKEPIRKRPEKTEIPIIETNSPLNQETTMYGQPNEKEDKSHYQNNERTMKQGSGK